MKKSFKATLLALVLASALLLAACGTPAKSTPAASSSPAASSETLEQTASTPTPTTLVIGASPAPHAEILEQVVPILAKQGITLEIKVFNDYIVPNTALNDGSLDANYFQHLPYLEDFNAKNGMDLVSAAAIHIEPLGIYPGRLASLEEITDGTLIGIPNDPTNESRALHLLETLGYITLKEGVGFEAVPSDIIENPNNLKFTELEAAQLPASLPDLDFAIINGNYAVGAELGASVLATEGAESPYVNIVAVRNGDENREDIKALVAALQTEEIKNFILETYNGAVLPVS